jgi:Cd2+/Zn2+-exporting ATPase
MTSPSLAAPTGDTLRANSLFTRYKAFLLSKETLFAAANTLFLLLGLILQLAGQPQLGRWSYLLAAVIGGTPLFIYSARGLFIHRDITAGVMASSAMIAAIVVGEYSAAALVVFMFTIGEWLENLTVARADNALRELASLVPTVVTLVEGDDLRQVPIAQVRPGHNILVRSGERIGVDGRVLQGRGSVGQAAITGESLPVEKQPGDAVYAGSLNELGSLTIEVTGVGEATTLGRIVQLVRSAKASQAPVERIANRYARYLVPLTFVLAGLVWWLSGEIMRAVTVLVVVCPCALVLATPTAVAAAIGNAARRGILVKTGGDMERVGQVDVVAFDKTSTLTIGEPRVRAVVPLDGRDEAALLALAATVERHSEHPIGRAIVAEAEARQLSLGQPTDFETLPGAGVSALVDGQRLLLGTPALLQERQVAWGEGHASLAAGLEQKGQTVIAVAIGDAPAGLIALADTVRPDARETIAQLKALGVGQIIMITGDNPRVAAAIAEELAVDRYYAEVLPERKLEIVRELQAEGKRVAFVGDGVNDAPALAAADIGIAMGLSGTDVALETADIGLMQDEIGRVPQVIDLSRSTMVIIKQNVAFSLAFNLLSLVLGGLGTIGPVVGAILHEVSSVPTLANSARLINKRYDGGRARR